MTADARRSRALVAVVVALAPQREVVGGCQQRDSLHLILCRVGAWLGRTSELELISGGKAPLLQP